MRRITLVTASIVFFVILGLTAGCSKKRMRRQVRPLRPRLAQRLKAPKLSLG